MKPRTLIIVGVVLTLLFIVGVGGGALNGSGSKLSLNDLKNASWRQSLDNILTRKLDPADMTLATGSPAGCVVQAGQIVIPNNATCTFQISETGLPTNRRLSLELVDGTTVTFTLDQPEAETEPKLDARKVSIDVYKSGGKLSMTCTNIGGSSAGCKLTIV